MDLYDAQSMARTLMVQHGVSHYTFKYDGAKRRMGQTNYTRQTISLSRGLTENRSVDDVKNTILHEIAHVIAGPEAGHGPMWVRAAKAIGCDGKRCGDLTDDQKVAPNWQAVCPSGCVLMTRYRRPSASKRHSCPRCAPTFDARYIIQWVPYTG